ncbi:MAG: TonB-dependent receptor [Halioglobus sp.]
MTLRYCTLPLAAALLAHATLPLAAIAQTQRASQTALLEELVVTARKREQNLQDVAVGVSLLTGKALAEAQLRNAADLSTLIPTLNVQASSGPSTSSFNIRGIGTQAFSTAVEPSVSTMLDGVVMSNSGMAFLELVDIERVEVLRGPQGTLYGKNASGGVIHIITRDPTAEFSGTVSGTAIEDDEYRLDATFSGPITDSLGYRITGSVLDDGGYAENRFNGKKVNSAENYNLRGKLLWAASEDLELEWSSDVSDGECDCNTLSVRDIRESAQQAALLAEQLPVVPSKGNQDVNNDQPTFNKTRASGHSLTVDWSVAEHVLTSISAWRDWDYEGIVDLDNRPSNPLALTFNVPPHNEVQQLSQELRIASAPAAWGSYVAGLFYFDQDSDSGNITTTALLAPLLPPTTRITDTRVSSTNFAIFGELNYNLNEDWQLTLGARYTEDKLKYRTSAVGTDNIVFGPEGQVNNTLSESDISPKIALQWNVSEAAMTYISYVSGYKGPAFDTSVVAGGRVIAAETSDAFELGYKSTWLDNRLILNVSAFYAEYTDFQAQALVDEDPNDLLPESFLLVNAGEVSTQGVEIEFITRPLDNWTITGGLSYTDGSIDDYPAGNCSAGQKFRGECPLGFQDLAGGQLPYTPEWKLNLSTDYRHALTSMPAELRLGADLRAQDDTLFEISQDQYTRQDAYAILDVRAGIAGTDSGYQVTAFVKNVLDKNYATLIFAQASELIPHGYIHSVPKYANRTLGIELRYDF